MGKITKYLNQLIVGSVFDTPDILEAYSIDRSILKIKPKFVAFPESTEDIRKLVRFFNQIAAREIPVSITARGSGLDEGGADLSSNLIISTEKLNKMLEIDHRERLVRVQAGITLKELNTALSVYGLTIPISGHSENTIGGLISTAPVDDNASKHGGIRRFVERIEVVLSNGECLQTSRIKNYYVAKKATEKSLEGNIYAKMSKLLKTQADLVEMIDKTDEHNHCGYFDVARAERRDTLDLMPLFFGAEGTLGIISEVILRAVPISKKTSRVVATFRAIEPALQFAKDLKSLKPLKINLYDLKIIQEARESGKNLDGVIKKLEDGFVIFASFDEKPNTCLKKVMSMQENYRAKFIFESPENTLTLNEFENALPVYLNAPRNGERLPILTDFYLPEYNIDNFLKDLKVLEQKLGLDLALFGSYSNSIYSLRPKFNLEDKELNKKIATFLRAGAYVINRQGGKLAGGTPEGRVKAVVTNTELKDPEKEFYTAIKQIFDPNNILNPDIKIGASSKFTLTHFRNTGSPKIMI